MGKIAKCYKCGTLLTRSNYDSVQDGLVCPNPDCFMNIEENGQIKQAKTITKLEPQYYVDMNIQRK